MSLEGILEHILSEAREAAEKIIQQVRQEQESLIKEAQSKAAELYNQILATHQKVYEKQKQKVIVEMRLASKKNLLIAKQTLIEEVFAKVTQEIQKAKLKKHQILPTGIEEVVANADFYLADLRHAYEAELAKILFAQ
jgi:vacuolar-type H+-ATPase subunit E/Vma4